MRTPIDTLREKYFKTGMLYETDFDEADAMHKEDIESAYSKGCANNMNDEGDFEQYYYEKFGGEDE